MQSRVTDWREARYDLDPATHAYALTGIHHDELKLTLPFAVHIDLTEVDRL